MDTTDQVRSPGQMARDGFEAIFDRRDIDAMRPLWTDESVLRLLALGIDVRGADAIAAFFRELFAAAPDAKMTIDHVVEDDRHAVVQWTLTATFDGAPFQGIEATGKPIALRGCDVFRYTEDRKLESNTVYYDGAEFARQIGMLPRRGSAADRGLLQAFNARVRLQRRLKSR
jgi:steroid delta-isomerase-like uncharacterized protein